jgi:hypothetical protein
VSWFPQVDDDVEEGSPAERRGVMDGQPFVQCARATNACYSLWHVDVGPNGTSVNVFNIQGESSHFVILVSG